MKDNKLDQNYLIIKRIIENYPLTDLGFQTH